MALFNPGGRPPVNNIRTSGTWKALPRGQARTAPWKAPQAANRVPKMSTGNWQALSAYQQIVRGIGGEAASGAPALGRFGFASAVAAAFVALFVGGASCASEIVSVRMSTPKKTAQMTYTDDNVLTFISKGQCAAGARPPTQEQIRKFLAKKCDGGPSIDLHDVTKCTDGGWSWHIEIGCDMSSQPELARKLLVMKLRALSKIASRPDARVDLNWLPKGSSQPTAGATPKPRPVLERPRPEPRPEPRRPADDEGGDDEIVF